MKPSIFASTLPAYSFLIYEDQKGNYTDCYSTVIKGTFSHAEFVSAFYSTWLFKVERFILKYVASKPSTDTDVQLLANNAIAQFAAWDVECRDENQILLADYQGKTKSFLMVEHLSIDAQLCTRLYFGSAVVAIKTDRGVRSIGWQFKALLGFHKAYSVALLYCAQSRLKSQCSSQH